MPQYKYLIAGGGMTADAAARGIRQIDANGTIGMVSLENSQPYDRPPLTKGLWKGKAIERIWRRTEEFGVAIHLGKELRTLDLAKKQVADNHGDIYSYEKLLLATGGSPRTLNLSVPGVIYFRTLSDYQALRALSDVKQSFVVIGGGFIGSEIAAALSSQGKKVTMVFLEEGIGRRTFPKDLSLFINHYYEQKGIALYAGATVKNITRKGDQFSVQIKNVDNSQENEITADGVIAGLGILPNSQLAEKAGLNIGNGIIVDKTLHTNHPDVLAAGDVAFFYNPALDKQLRVEHEDNANQMGITAGRNMAGENQSYDHLPFFYSDLFELGYEAVGELDSRLTSFADWQEPNKKGVIYYLDQNRVKGVLLWNVWDQVENARRLIAERNIVKEADLKGRLPA